MQIKTSNTNFALNLGTYFVFKFIVMSSLYILMSTLNKSKLDKWTNIAKGIKHKGLNLSFFV